MMTRAEVAAMFTAFAKQIDVELAAGTPPKAVAQVAADLAREYAIEALGRENAPDCPAGDTGGTYPSMVGGV
jgi:hypothetical protein